VSGCLVATGGPYKQRRHRRLQVADPYSLAANVPSGRHGHMTVLPCRSSAFIASQGVGRPRKRTGGCFDDVPALVAQVQASMPSDKADGHQRLKRCRQLLPSQHRMLRKLLRELWRKGAWGRLRAILRGLLGRQCVTHPLLDQVHSGESF
jgi:hypothetical protein